MRERTIASHFVRAALRGARVNYRGLGVQGDTVTVTLVGGHAHPVQGVLQIPQELTRPAGGGSAVALEKLGDAGVVAPRPADHIGQVGDEPFGLRGCEAAGCG